MKIFHLASAALLLAAPFALAQTSTWKSDAAHSDVGFSIVHMGLDAVPGSFGKVSATIVYDEKDITKSTVNATIDVAGLDTRNESRDADVKGGTYFDTAKYPTATFASTSVAKGGSGLLVSGNLTIKGITKAVVLDVEGPRGPVTGMDKKPHVGFSASTTIHRTDFGIGANVPTMILSDDVKITINLDAAKQ